MVVDHADLFVKYYKRDGKEKNLKEGDSVIIKTAPNTSI